MDQTREQNGSTVRGLRAELAVLGQVSREQERGLSGGFYTSREWLEFERETLFRTEWICLGHVGSIPAIGTNLGLRLLEQSQTKTEYTVAKRRLP